MVKSPSFAFLLLFLLTNFWGYPQNIDTKSGKDSLLYWASVYLDEDPQKALSYSVAAYAAKNSDKNYKFESLLHLAESYLNLGAYDKTRTYIDSALLISDASKNLKQKIKALKLSGELDFQLGNSTSANKSLNQARQLAHNNKMPDEEIGIVLQIGDYLKQQGRFKESIKTKRVALDIAIKSKDNRQIADCWKGLGNTYWYFSFFNEALEHFYKGYIIYDEFKDTLQVISSLKNLSLCYRDLGNYEKALSQLNLAMKILENKDSEIEVSEIFNSLGSLNYRFNRYAEALTYYKQSLEIRNKLGLLTSTANTLENIARAYLKKNQYDEAISALDKAYEIRVQLYDQLATASTLNEMGNLYNQKGNIAEALRRYLQSLKIRQQIGNSKEIAKSLTNIGLTYRKLGLINNATRYLEQAKQLINMEDPQEASYILINLGNLYIDQKLYDKALSVFQEALFYREKTGDEIGIAKSLKSLALAQQQQGLFDKAAGNLQKALKIARKLNDGRAIADVLNDLGNLERQRGRLKEAKKYFEDAALTYDESAIFDGKALCLRKVGEVQIKLGQLDEAEKNINLSINLGKEIGNMALVQFGYLAKNEFYKAKNNYKLAYDFYVKHIKLRDSLENMRKNETNLEAQLDLELDKKREELRLLESEVEVLKKEATVKELKIEKQHLNQVLLIVISLLILTVAGGSLYLYYQKKKHNKLLVENINLIKEMNDKLAQSEIDLITNIQTKNKLFSIIAHDLRSPFTGLIGLTGILASKSNELTKEEVAEYSKEINNSSEKLLSLIENLLTWARSQKGEIKLNPGHHNLKSIIEPVVEIASTSAKRKQIQLNINIKNDISVYADLETITTVFRNLISNAIKFTPPKGNVKISATNKKEKVEILISDNGVGISPQNLSGLFHINKNISTKGTENERGTGLGLIICKDFVEKNNGTISVDSELNTGTTFKITLPKHQNS